MKNIDVSFVVPLYNDSNHLLHCFNNIRNQGIDSYEIIFIDDCSEDNTVNNIKTLKKIYKNITLIKNNKNMGPGYSRNEGLKIAKGDYIRFVDCDDDIIYNSTKLLFDYIKIKKFDVVRGGYECINENKKRIFINTLNTNFEINNNTSSDIILKFLDGHWCFLFNREFLLKNKLCYNEKYRQAEDAYLIQNLLLKTNKIFFIKDLVYKYVIHNKGRLTNERTISVVYNFQSLFENFLDICLKIKRIDVFYKRFINSFNYIYVDRFFSIYDSFNKEDKILVINRLKNLLLSSKININIEDIKKDLEKHIKMKYLTIINDIIYDNEQHVILMKQNDILKEKYVSKNKIHNAITYKNSISLYAWTRKLNFGDQIIFDILNKFNLIYHLSTLNKCELISIGSILHNFLLSTNAPYYSKKLHCWGSGFISNKEEHLQKLIGQFIWQFNRDIEFHALRGKYTQSIVEKIINKKLSIPLGDPGLLINKVMPEIKNKKYDVGIVLHWKEYIDDIKNKIRLHDYSIKYISPMREPSIVVNEIKECNCILSSSLHGLIVADSFNIPNRHIIASNKVEGNNFKFKDYYSAFINYPYKNFDLNKFIITDDTIDRIINNYNIREHEINKICDNLLYSFPYDIKL